MRFTGLIVKNALRQKLRTLLTVFGMAVAILAFALLATVVDAWYLGVNSASPDRLVTRNAVSLIFPLPLSYRTRMLQVPGIARVAYANWFGGVYIDDMDGGPSRLRFYDLASKKQIQLPVQGIVAHAETTSGGRTVYVTTCGGGLRVYHAYVASKGVVVSILSTGPRLFGDLLMAGIRG